VLLLPFCTWCSGGLRNGRLDKNHLRFTLLRRVISTKMFGMPANEWENSPEIFLKFDYIETKDLCKSFLTLVAAVLIFSVTFSEKIIDFLHAGTRERVLLAGSWSALLLATVSCGIGTYFIFNAGLAASHQPTTQLYWTRTLIAFRALHLAGALFLVALILLVVSATASLHW
jgi:hypothetical protein